MNYRGYTVSMVFDRDDKIIVGLVVDIDDIISFHGDSVGECQANFRAVIDDCIAACQQTGAAPEKPASGKLMLRVAPTVHAAALKAAARSGVSLNKWAEKALSTASKKASGVRGSRAVGG